MKRRLVTSALPYVNNVPHLGNLIQVLSADVFARASRLLGHETLYVCGTDEYGTATETKAAEEGVSPKELCTKFYEIHKQIYEWFDIQFDTFGRTSSERQTEIVQSLFNDIDAAGYVREETMEQLYCAPCDRFLADRYVRGTCPHCGYADARGDQCEACGKLLDPSELTKPVCSSCGATPAPRATKHLYIDLPRIRPMLEEWMKTASVKGFWSNNAVQMTQAWIRDGLKPRAITRDLKWGIPVPKTGYEHKVFYVWFDAPIGYISITALAGDRLGFDWESWWLNRDDVELFQFIGKDNIPFHTVIFPSTLLASGKKWTMLHHMSSTEYLNYESGKFSKSKGVGVFGNDAMDTGIPASVWRFYIFYNRPEKSDVTFTWQDFLEKVNSELIGNLGNLANRTLAFIERFYGGVIPHGKPDEEFWKKIRGKEETVRDMLERAELRDAFHAAFEIADMANKRFQAEEPWKARTAEPEKAASLLSDLSYVLRDLAVIMYPYMPSAMENLAGFFGLTIAQNHTGHGLSWSDVGTLSGLTTLKANGILFNKLEPEHINELRERYAGSQKERTERESAAAKPQIKKEETKPVPKPAPYAELPLAERFARLLDLRVAVISGIERHPKADKLYIEKLDDGSGTERTIVSGLVPFYAPEELLGKHIIIVNNLKPAKLRGVESRGMLLAASHTEDGEKETVEVLDVPWAAPGTRVVLEGYDETIQAQAEIDVDAFFSVPLRAAEGSARAGELELKAAGRSVRLAVVKNGEIG